MNVLCPCVTCLHATACSIITVLLPYLIFTIVGSQNQNLNPTRINCPALEWRKIQADTYAGMLRVLMVMVVRGGGLTEFMLNQHQTLRWEMRCNALADLQVITRCESHLHSGTDWCEGIHLGEAHRLAVHSRRLDHDGGAGLALRPGRCWGVGWFGLIRQQTERQNETWR